MFNYESHSQVKISNYFKLFFFYGKQKIGTLQLAKFLDLYSTGVCLEFVSVFFKIHVTQPEFKLELNDLCPMQYYFSFPTVGVLARVLSKSNDICWSLLFVNVLIYLLYCAWAKHTCTHSRNTQTQARTHASTHTHQHPWHWRISFDK